jgi:exopolysaccharide production protein ExoZ
LGKIQNIQALRGAAAFAVVVFHLIPIENKYGGGTTILPLIFQHGKFGVDLFFVISGFVMVTITRGQFQKSKDAFIFLYHRAARIYPPYWFYSLLLLAVFTVRPTWINSAQGNQVDIVSSFLLLPQNALPLLNVGWTLIHELYFYLVFFLLLLVVSGRYLSISLLIWSATVVALNICLENKGPTLQLISHPLTLEFIGGCFLAKFFYEGPKIKISLVLIIAAVVMAATLLGFMKNGDNTSIPSGWWRVALYGIPASLVVYFITMAEAHGHISHPFLVKLGDASYSIYLSHILVLSAVGRIWFLFGTDSFIDNIFMIPFLFICVIAYGMISYQVIERPLIRLSRYVA